MLCTAKAIRDSRFDVVNLNKGSACVRVRSELCVHKPRGMSRSSLLAQTVSLSNAVRTKQPAIIPHLCSTTVSVGKLNSLLPTRRADCEKGALKGPHAEGTSLQLRASYHCQ